MISGGNDNACKGKYYYLTSPPPLLPHYRDTVLTIRVLGDMMISGGKDNACKGKWTLFSQSEFWET